MRRVASICITDISNRGIFNKISSRIAQGNPERSSPERSYNVRGTKHTRRPNIKATFGISRSPNENTTFEARNMHVARTKKQRSGSCGLRDFKTMLPITRAQVKRSGSEQRHNVCISERCRNVRAANLWGEQASLPCQLWAPMRTLRTL